jgi:hypothetical protein
MTNYFRKPDALVDAVNAVLSGQPVQEKMDPVDQKALKGKHSDRKDKDIDNDGDVDSSDEYLHKRRKAVSKAMKEEVELDEKVAAYDKNGKVVGLYRNMADAKRLKPNHTYKIHKEETEDNPANTQHLCAKNVVHESWGEGSCIPTMHADPDEDGNIEWYDVMFDHGIEEQVSIEELKVTKAESHIHSSKKKIKESDDEDDEDDEDDDEDDSDEDEENGKKKKVSGKKDDVDVEPEMDDAKMVSEKEMTPAQEKKREEIVLSMKKEMPRFKKKYGDRAKDVMYATATKMAMKEGFELGIEKSDLIEEVELDEAKIAKKVPAKDGGHFVVLHRDTSGMRGTQDKFHMRHLKNGKVKDYGTHSSLDGALKFAKNRGIIEEVELDEAKSGTGYDLYHKDFSSAMQHAYDHAKKKHGITINPKEIDDKVATGPAKPKEGKTNTYRLKGDKGAIQVQVYNKGGSKPFELNMYKEEVDLDEAKVTKKMINDLEDRNEHGMVALKLAQAYGTAAEVKKVQDINKRHNQRGHIEHKDQKERDVIIRKYYKMAEEVELDEGFINIGGAKVKDDEKSILQHIKKTFPNVKKVKKDPQHGWIPVFEELDLDEGRGRPRKDGTTGGSEDRDNVPPWRHIQMQLRKSVSLRGLKDVEFADGKKVKVPAKVAQGVMSKINSIKDAKQKQNAVQHIAKSHKHMMDFHKGDYKDADAKRQDILKLK